MNANANNQRPQGIAPLNPERPPQLLGKYSKLLGKDLKEIKITYDADGVTVEVDGMEGSPYEELVNASIAAFKAMKAALTQPDDTERLQSFKNKFELRLNREFPATGPASGSEADIQAFLNGLNFRERRALMMTQKQFTASYPNGFPAA